MLDRNLILEEDGELVLVDAQFVAQPAPELPPAPEPEPVTPAPAPEAGEGASSAAPPDRQTATKPEDASWEEWHRRQDAVRTIAREFDAVDHGDIREFLAGKTTRDLSDDEVGQILHDIQAQRVFDLTEIFDEQLRSGSERLKRARRTVRVQAPRGWVKRAFSTLDERAVGQVAARLIQRGHDPETIKEKVVNRIRDEEVRANINTKIDNEELSVEFDAGAFTQPPMVSLEQPISMERALEFATEMAETVARNMPVPDIYVEVPVNVGGTKKKIKRNAETGLIEEVEDE